MYILYEHMDSYRAILGHYSSYSSGSLRALQSEDLGTRNLAIWEFPKIRGTLILGSL